MLQAATYITEKNGRKRPAAIVDCDTCGTSFLKQKRFIAKNKSHYCSRKCSFVNKIERVKLNCDLCDAAIERLPNRVQAFNFCNKICKDKAQRIDSGDKFKKLRPSHFGTAVGYRTLYQRSYDSLECKICGFDKVVHIHHIDEDKSNNSIENLVALCPNHHAMIHTTKFNEEVKKDLGM